MSLPATRPGRTRMIWLSATPRPSQGTQRVNVLWALLGLVVGLAGGLPLLRVSLRRAERRARAAEGRARDSQRLAELGSMTGGLAHEIKNPLSTIGLNAQLLAEGIGEADLPPEQRDRLLRRLDSLSREADRLRTILTDLLPLARIVANDEPDGPVAKVAYAVEEDDGAVRHRSPCLPTEC